MRLINIGRLAIGLAWADTLSWEVTTEKEKRMYYFCIQRVTERCSGNNAYELVVGPMSLVLGVRKVDT